MDMGRVHAERYATHLSRSSGCNFIHNRSDSMDDAMKDAMKLTKMPQFLPPKPKRTKPKAEEVIVTTKEYVVLTDEQIESCRKGQDIFDFARDIEELVRLNNQI
jgi:hypothetical protein